MRQRYLHVYLHITTSTGLVNAAIHPQTNSANVILHFQLVFQASIGAADYGDIAIDDVRVDLDTAECKGKMQLASSDLYGCWFCFTIIYSARI